MWVTKALGWALAVERLRSGNTAWLLLICLMFFTLLLTSNSYIAVLPLVQEEWGLNNTQSGVIFSSYLAAYAFSALVIIPLTDRVGPARVLMPSLLLAIASGVAFPALARDIVSASLIEACAGIGLVGVYMPGVRLIAERFDGPGRGTAVGLFVTALYAAYSASLAGTGALLDLFAWRNAYLVMALLSAFSVPMAYLVLRGYHGRVARPSSGRLQLRVLRSRPFRFFVFAYALHSLELFAARTWLPVFLLAVYLSRGAERGDAEATAATVAGLALAAGALGPLMGGAVSDRFGRVTSAMAIFALSGACSWAIGWTAGLPLALIIGLGVVYGWATAADSAIYSTAVTEVTDPPDLGSALAVHAFVGFMGGAVGPVVLGGILDLSPEAHRFGLGFSALGVLALVAVLALLRLGSVSLSGSIGRDRRAD